MAAATRPIADIDIHPRLRLVAPLIIFRAVTVMFPGIAMLAPAELGRCHQRDGQSNHGFRIVFRVILLIARKRAYGRGRLGHYKPIAIP
jgi:hypothetical protein